MHYISDVVLAANFLDDALVIDVALKEWHRTKPRLIAKLERVEYNNVATLRRKQSNGVGSDVPSATGNENGHLGTLARGRSCLSTSAARCIFLNPRTLSKVAGE